jgi:hypothetical protein
MLDPHLIGEVGVTICLCMPERYVAASTRKNTRDGLVRLSMAGQGSLNSGLQDTGKMEDNHSCLLTLAIATTFGTHGTFREIENMLH